MSMKLKNIFFALAITMVGAFFSCENSLETIKEIASDDSLFVSVRAFDVDFTRTDSAKLQVRLVSPVMEKYEGKDPYTVFPTGFEVIFFDSIGRETSSIKANYGIMYERSKDMRARNDVVVKNFETQEQLFTENLYWDRRKKTIRSGTFVKIITPDKVIYGDSLRANESFSNREIYGVRGELEIDEDESPQ